MTPPRPCSAEPGDTHLSFLPLGRRSGILPFIILFLFYGLIMKFLLKKPLNLFLWYTFLGVGAQGEVLNIYPLPHLSPHHKHIRKALPNKTTGWQHFTQTSPYRATPPLSYLSLWSTNHLQQKSFPSNSCPLPPVRPPLTNIYKEPHGHCAPTLASEEVVLQRNVRYPTFNLFYLFYHPQF